MEGRASRYAAQVSPERSKVWTEPSPKHPMQRKQSGKVPVVYYLCKNRHLEHPHFIEVPVSSPGGLYLKDVVNRLVVLRGKRMPGMYSWSCKRSYKSGFVWQDLSEDDLILPAHGNEYILKGSELLDQTPPDRLLRSGNTPRLQSHLSSQQESTRVPEPSSSYSSPVSTVREGKSPSPPDATLPPQEDDSPVLPHQSISQETGFSSFGECMAFMVSGAQDASTQTEDRGERRVHQEPTIHRSTVSQPNVYDQSDDAIKKEMSPSQTPSSTSSGAKIDTLESLIRAEVNKFSSFRIIEEEDVVPMKEKMRRANPLLQLLACGSTLVKNHNSLGFIQTYKPRFLNMRFAPTFPSSTTLREVDYMSEGSRVMRLAPDGRNSFSRNRGENYLIYKEEGREASPSFSCTPFYNNDIRYKSPDLSGSKEKVTDFGGSNGCPSTIQNFASKPIMNGILRSPILDARSSPAQQIHCKSPSSSSFSASNRIDNVTSLEGSSMKAESFQEETERTIKIEERLTSGARIIIQSRVPSDYINKCSGS